MSSFNRLLENKSFAASKQSKSSSHAENIIGFWDFETIGNNKISDGNKCSQYVEAFFADGKYIYLDRYTDKNGLKMIFIKSGIYTLTDKSVAIKVTAAQFIRDGEPQPKKKTEQYTKRKIKNIATDTYSTSDTEKYYIRDSKRVERRKLSIGWVRCREVEVLWALENGNIGEAYFSTENDDLKKAVTAESLGKMAVSSYAVKDYSNARIWGEKAAEKNQAEGYWVLGKLHFSGAGGYKSDYVEAVKWHRKGAEAGHPGSQNALGNAYYRGRGVKRDNSLSVDWHEKAAEQGLVSSQFFLATTFWYGEPDIEIDLEKSLLWFEKVISSNSVDAKMMERSRKSVRHLKDQIKEEAEELKLELARKKQQEEIDKDEFWTAIRTNDFGSATRLIRAGKSPNSLLGGISYVHRTASYGSPKMLEFLLANEGDANSILKGKTPLFLAASKGRISSLEVLIKHGGDVHAEIKSGINILSYALGGENLEVVEYLLKKGVKFTPELKKYIDELFRKRQTTGSIIVQSKALTDYVIKYGPKPMHAVDYERFASTNFEEFDSVYKVMQHFKGKLNAGQVNREHQFYITELAKQCERFIDMTMEMHNRRLWSARLAEQYSSECYQMYEKNKRLFKS
ncbi:hypothetical protein A9Q83_09630 [Alphaproteobacteria bacterium 46_93_T64]|nr:hypothetical protein A9Q83_09630 [Alphaproteobacteria bacterium 46_93_T64]